MRLSTALKGAALAGLALAIALIAAAKAIDFNAYKAFVAEQVKSATGRELTIAGPLELKPGLVPLLVANGVSLSNAPGGSRAEMVKVDRIEAEIALLPLLKREIRVQRLVLSGPDILLENGNWRLSTQIPAASDPAQGVPPTRFTLRELKIKNGHIGWRDDAGQVDGMNLHKLSVQPDHGPAKLLALQIIGDYQARDFTIAGTVGSMTALGGGKPFPVQVKAAYRGVTATADGAIGDPFAFGGIDLKLAAQGDELADIVRLAGHKLPAIGPFKVAARLGGSGERPTLSEIDAVVGRRDAALISAKGTIKDVTALAGIDLVTQIDSENLAGLSRLTGTEIPSMGPLRLSGALRGGGNDWQVVDLRASLAGSDLAGEGALVLGRRPHVTAKLHSTTLALADFTTPAARPGERLEPKPAARPGGDGRLFSAEPLPLSALRQVDADLSLQVSRLVVGPSPLTDVTLKANLRSGSLTVAPLHALLAGGVLDGEAAVNAALARPTVSLRLTGRQIDAGRVVKDSGVDLLSGGRADLRLALAGSGLSVREVMASATGEAVLSLGEGRIHNRAIDWAGGDLMIQTLGALNPLAKSDDTTQMSCAVARFTIKGGIATADRGIAVETAKVDVVGAGTVNLGTEAIDIGVTPRARDGLGLSLGGQLAGVTRLGGTLARPSLAIDEIGTVRTAASMGAAVATGGLSLLGELLYDKVTADDFPCRTALAARAPAKVGGKPAAKSDGGLIEGLFGR